MGILASELNYAQILNDLADCCLGTKTCGTCKEKLCLIGYSKEQLKQCLTSNVTYTIDGFENIPKLDNKKFNDKMMISGISHILKQCKSCKEDHYENCLVNVIRSCYEMALMGRTVSYEGSAYKYIEYIEDVSTELGEEIMGIYRSIK